MGSIPKSVKSVAASGGLIALALGAGCGSSNDARARDAVASSASTDTATAALDSVRSGPTTADNAASPEPPVPATGAVASDTLCEAGETPFFSCEVGAKRVSVCSSGSGAIYRYGTSAKVELTSHSLTSANRSYSGGGESQLTAKNGDYTYTVYDRTVRTSFGGGGNDPEFSSGLLVSRGGRVISSKMCKSEASVNAGAERALPGGSFVEH
jgi:hypothetical protein